MANNQYINRVDVYRNGSTDTLINIGDTTAIASDVAQGKYFYLATGEKVAGTSSGGIEDGHVWQDENGYIHLSEETGNVYQAVSKSYTPTETAQSETITPSSGYDALSSVSVSVGAISSTYVGSGITRRDSSDADVDDEIISFPAGYYADQHYASVGFGSATTPATTITANPSISVGSDGLITATASATKSVTPTISAGYVSSASAAAGTITVSGSNTSQLSTQAATTITPTTSAQTAVAAGKYTTGAVTVAAMPTGSVSASASKGTVSNHSVSVTPTATVGTAGYLAAGSTTGTAVTVSASELVSGNKEITANGTGIDVADYSTVSVAVPTVTITQTGSTLSIV